MDVSPAIANGVSDLKVTDKPEAKTPEPVSAPPTETAAVPAPKPQQSRPAATVVVSVPCSGANCTNAAPNNLICPTCQKQGLPRAPFCSQDCLKKNWSVHKKVHKSKQQLEKEKVDPDSPSSFAIGASSAVSWRERWLQCSWRGSSFSDYDPFPWFPYTGSLRPVYPKTPLPVGLCCYCCFHAE